MGDLGGQSSQPENQECQARKNIGRRPSGTLPELFGVLVTSLPGFTGVLSDNQESSGELKEDQ